MQVEFDRILWAESADECLDIALRRGREAASRVKGITDWTAKQKAKSKDRLRAIQDVLAARLANVHDCYPDFDSLSEFVQQIFSMDMDIGKVKQALGGVQHAIRTMKGICKEYIQKINHAKTPEDVKRLERECIGRIASLVKQTDTHLGVLNEARLVFRKMPVVDDSLFTVAIAGFPNVGKSTLLRMLTAAEPEIQPYAFTTKGLNVGYFEYMFNRIQCIDTPGTLNRKTMNQIERKADIALRYLASVIVYVFDPTEASAPLTEQEALYEHLKSLDKDILIYVSKADIASPNQIAMIGKRHEHYASAQDLKEMLAKKFRQWTKGELI